MSTLDRYVFRLMLPPFLIALGVFTFVLGVEPILDHAKDLLAKGVSIPTAAWLLSCLLPQALALTIPMALLTGVLMALGRLSGDRESVALVACGVSPFRLLRPVLVLGLLAAGLDMYVLMRGVPDGNQTFNDITFRILTEQTTADIKPRIFYDRFPGKVLYIRDSHPDGTWSGVLLADSTLQQPAVTLADEGALVIDREHRSVRLVLTGQTTYSAGRTDPRVYLVSAHDDLTVTISAESVFGNAHIVPGLHDMTRAQLYDAIAAHRGRSEPAHAEIIQLQQMFSFPVACLVFAVIGLGVGLNTRKEGRLAGLTLGLAIIMVYYATMGLAEAWAKGAARSTNLADFAAGGRVEMIATWVRWVPNIVVGLIGALALWRQARPNGLNLPVRAPRWWIDWRARIAARVPQQREVRPRTARLPRWVPLPRLLDRYVSSHFLRAGALAFLGLLALYYIGAFVDLADKIKRPGDGEIFLNFLINSTPQFLIFVIPIATLIAALGAIGGLTRSGELVVMRACGVSLYRASAPLLVFALVFSGVLLLVEERVLGEANHAASALRNQFRDHPDQPDLGVTFRNHQWLVGEDGRIYHYALFTPADATNGGKPTIQDLSVFDVELHPYRLGAHLYAAHARFDGTAWRLDRGWTQEFNRATATRTDFTDLSVTLANIAEFQNASIDPDTMSYFDARRYVARLGASGFNVTEDRVNLHRRLAFPLVTVVMTLLAIPFGVTIGRKGALYGIGLATILAGSYFLVMTFFVAFGSAGLLPPMLAAWGANILFAAGATYMILTVRT